MDENQLDLLVRKIADNELIVNNILTHLNQKDLYQCLLVCRQWYYLAKSVDRSKRRIFQIISVFLIDRFNSIYMCRPETLKVSEYGGKSNDSLSGGKGTEIFENQFFKMLAKSYSKPKCLILFEGNNTKIGKKRRWKRARVINTIRAKLPHDCAVVGIDAHYGILGESSESALTDSKDPKTISYDICGMFGISCFMLPKYDGITLTVFERSTDDMEEEFIVPDDIKAVILFSSGVGHRGGYLAHSQVDAIFDHYRGKLALGGAQINDKLVTRQPTVLYYSDDTANFYFINGPPPYNPMFNPKKMSLIGIQFSGPKCSAASLSIDSLSPYMDGDMSDDPGDLIEKELDLIVAKVTKFKSNLPFNCDKISSRRELIAFLFFNFDSYSRYYKHTDDVNAGVSIFYKVFPKVHITGVLCHAQYEHNYIPHDLTEVDQLDNQLSELNVDPSTPESKSNILPSPRGIASFVIIEIQK